MMEEPKEEKKDILLTITLNNEGVKVDGPINNEPLSLWLLDKAKDIVKIHNIQQNTPKIEKPHGIMGFVRNFKR